MLALAGVVMGGALDRLAIDPRIDEEREHIDIGDGAQAAALLNVTWTTPLGEAVAGPIGRSPRAAADTDRLGERHT